MEFIREERGYYDTVKRSIPRSAMRVLSRIAQMGMVSELDFSAFPKTCNLTPGQIQNAMKKLVSEDKMKEQERGISIADPLEGVCLQMVGLDGPEGSELLEPFLRACFDGTPQHSPPWCLDPK